LTLHGVSRTKFRHLTADEIDDLKNLAVTHKIHKED
jgi:hypothetical protein